MKRTSVQYNVTSSYSRNIESENASKKVRANSCLVSLVGIFLIVSIAIFIIIHL